MLEAPQRQARWLPGEMSGGVRNVFFEDRDLISSNLNQALRLLGVVYAGPTR